MLTFNTNVAFMPFAPPKTFLMSPLHGQEMSSAVEVNASGVNEVKADVQYPEGSPEWLEQQDSSRVRVTVRG